MHSRFAGQRSESCVMARAPREAFPAFFMVGLSAADIMQRKVVSVEAQESIIDAGKLMLVTRLPSLPVIHRRSRSARPELVGMVSRGDLLRGLGFPVKGGAHRSPTRSRAYGKSHR